MRFHHILIAAVVAAAPTLPAQQVAFFGPEVRPFIAAYLPEGGLGNDFKSATTLGAQAAYELSPNFHVLGSLGWTHGHNTYAALDDDRTWIWQYDVGAELNLVRKLGDQWLLRPFGGLGAGGRTYDYRASSVGKNTCATGYASAGTELQRGILAWRFEGRGYLACFESPITGKKQTRNDYSLAFGAAWHFR
jgi:hypothetical protein